MVKKLILTLALLLAVAGGILSVVNIGGDLILALAQRTLKEQMGLDLTAEGITGNPIRGYTLRDFAITAGGAPILSARSLSGKVNFGALFRGSIRLALEVGGVDMDLDQFIQELQRINLPEGGGGGEVPIDRVSLADSRLTSQWGTVEVNTVGLTFSGRNLDVDVDGRVNGIPVKGDGELDLSDGILINRSEVSFGKGKVLATGGVRPNPEGANVLDLQGAVQDVDLQELTALWPAFLKPQDYEGRANLNLEARGTAETLALAGSLDYQGRRLGGYPVERVGANVKYSAGRLTISDIQASALNIPIAGEAALNTQAGQNPSIMLKLDGGEAQLDGLGAVFPELKGLGGRVSSFKTNLQGPTNALSGTISLSAPKVSYQDWTVSNIAAQVKLVKGSSATVNGKFAFEGAQGYLQGTVSPLLKPGLDLTAKLVDLDVKRLASRVPDASQYRLAGKVTAALTLKGPASAPSISGTVSSPSLSGAGQTLTNPSVTFSFAKDTLTLQKSSGSLNGMPIHLSGTLGPLPSSTPGVNVNATLTVSPAALKAYVPGIESYNLKGNINAGVKIQGKLPNPSLSLVASSPSLQALGTLTAKNIEVTTAMTGDLSKLDRVTVNAKAASLAASGLTLSDLTAKVDKNGDQITFKAETGGTPLTASGTVKLSPLNATVALRGKGLDLATLTRPYPDLKGQISGRADLTFDLTGTDKGTSGKGSLTAAALKAFGLNLSGVNLPLSWSGSTFSSSGGTAKLYGGTAKNTLTYNTATSKFTDELSASGVDVNALVQDAAGGLGGKITGEGKLSLKLSGSAAKSVSYSGSGQFSMGAGAITGFKWVDLAAQLHGSRGIRYASVSAPFSIQTGKLILKSGSIAKANRNDPIYTYAKLPQDGSIGFNKALNLVAELNVNAQLLNAIVGGGKGGLSELGTLIKGGGSSLQEGLMQVLGGSLKGARSEGAEADFRTVTVKIGGRADSPSLSLVKLGDSTKSSKQPQQGTTQKKDTQQAQQGTTQKKDTQQAQQQPKQQKKSLEDQAKDRLKEELKKGLGGLFKR